MKLARKVAIVTGASEGIGAALARLFVREGARVVLAARQEEKLRALAAELGLEQTLPVPTDVTDPAQVKRMIDRTVDRFGGLDILVNNAGVGLYSAVEEITQEKFRRMFEINFFGAVECTQAALPHLKQRRGTVVQMSSVAGKFAFPYMGGYNATKFALNSLSTALRMELAGTGVRVVLVCPGPVATRFQENALRDGTSLPDRFNRRYGGVTAEKVARKTLKAIVGGKREVVVPGYYRLLIGFRNLFPRFVDGVFARMVR